MSESQSLVNVERYAFYYKFDVKELETQLLEEKSFQNRNVIRQVIRQKCKDLKERSIPVLERKNEITPKIENLKDILYETTDYFENCKLRSSILYLQKNEKLQTKQDISLNSLNNKKNSEAEWQKLVYDEYSNSNIESAILKINDSVKLSWIMPFKILNSIEISWQYNEQDVCTSHKNRVTVDFDGRQAILTLTNLNTEDSGIYRITVHSLRLKRKSVSFKLCINEGVKDGSASVVIVEESKPEIKSANNNTQSPIVSVFTDKPKYGLNKNRFNRHKTMTGEELLGLKANIINQSILKNNQNEESQIVTPPRQNLRKTNRSATSAKDIILTFCKLNTIGYEKYGVCVENLSTSWTDGLAFCALIHHFHPEAFDFSKLNKSNRRENFELAFSTADKYAEIYPLLDIDDMLIIEKPDWKCIFTYVQCFYKTFRSHPKNKLKTVLL